MPPRTVLELKNFFILGIKAKFPSHFRAITIDSLIPSLKKSKPMYVVLEVAFVFSPYRIVGRPAKEAPPG